MKLFGFKNFDELLAFHCAPVLAGIKPANLICFHPDNDAELQEVLATYNQRFASRGIIFRAFATQSSRYLLLIYQPQELTQIVKQAGYQAYLTAAGYETPGTLDSYLETLAVHLQAQGCFPHEIGVFLGYPLEDILGFALNKGQNFKYSGYWKVYGDVEKARTIFSSYENCRDFILAKLAEGMSLKAACSAF